VSGAGCPRVTHPFAALPFPGLPLERFSLDLHVLGTPPAFVLSQDQTLRREPSDPAEAGLSGSLESRPSPEGTSGWASCGAVSYDRRRIWTRRTAPSLDGDAHWLLAHCSVLKVRARTPEAHYEWTPKKGSRRLPIVRPATWARQPEEPGLGQEPAARSRSYP
jgi:hypothetical protein